jgi:hypothetical protein
MYAGKPRPSSQLMQRGLATTGHAVLLVGIVRNGARWLANGQG